jgi:hypothetical protein
VKQVKKLTPEQKLLLSLRLYHSAKELKIVAIRNFYPEKINKEIKEKVKEIFFYVRY